MAEQGPTGRDPIAKGPIADKKVIAEHSGRLYTAGAIFIVVGLLAIVLPWIATIAAELLVGAALAVAGCAELFRAFRLRSTGAVLGSALLGILALVVGVILLAFPLQGALTLTVFLIAFFLAEGALKLIMAYEWRHQSGWGWTAFSGLASLVIGVALWLTLPGSALWAIGLLLGIDLLIFGWTLIAITVAATRT